MCIRDRDRAKKDSELLSKLEILSSAMNSVSDQKDTARQPQINQFQSSIGDKDRPEEQRMLLDELTKTLYLNNANPQKYNIAFFADHFNIEPQKLKNIFNYVSYAIQDEKNPKETGRVLRFISE
eukprot:TRINITY_DN4251_c0_g1_i5.p2 TRINITY_DN4251_c0_g1~~TRINITY_DN4251_c0_g1_i5.p2  ORF type:complete len:124 (-),score=25.21 TRINITY_DN4251_c0_g1_i5:130-501(-)